MKIGLAQINCIVGDLDGNKERILKAYKDLCAKGADLVVFPELIITGYPPRDLLFKSRFVRDNEQILEEIAKEAISVPLVLGFVRGKKQEGKTKIFYNAVAWCENGVVKEESYKCLLPSYCVFEEDRYFVPGSKPKVIKWKNLRVGLTICEDIWTGPLLSNHKGYDFDPASYLAKEGVDLVLNISASPWHYNKGAIREKLLMHLASQCKAPVVYVNAIGGQDELIFDGHSLVADASKRIRVMLSRFEEELKVVNLEKLDQLPEISSTTDIIQDIYKALVLGLRDYASKVGFQKAVIGLSGGIDSAVVAAIAVEALGAENIFGLSLPSVISSEHSKSDAQKLAKNLGIRLDTISIAKIVDASQDALKPLFDDLPFGVAEENIQARARGLLLMAVANKFNALLLTTGNKSEIAVGYCTLYGDMAGGLGVISDVTKMNVYKLAEYINRDKEIIPHNTIVKEPSAELHPGQKDADSLPPYNILDPIVCFYIEDNLSVKQISEKGFDSKLVKEIIRKIDLNEYKRKQAAPGLRITPLAFGIGRRMPIVQKYVN